MMLLSMARKVFAKLYGFLLSVYWSPYDHYTPWSSFWVVFRQVFYIVCRFPTHFHIRQDMPSLHFLLIQGCTSCFAPVVRTLPLLLLRIEYAILLLSFPILHTVCLLLTDLFFLLHICVGYFIDSHPTLCSVLAWQYPHKRQFLFSLSLIGVAYHTGGGCVVRFILVSQENQKIFLTNTRISLI